MMNFEKLTSERIFDHRRTEWIFLLDTFQGAGKLRTSLRNFTPPPHPSIPYRFLLVEDSGAGRQDLASNLFFDRSTADFLRAEYYERRTFQIFAPSVRTMNLLKRTLKTTIFERQLEIRNKLRNSRRLSVSKYSGLYIVEGSRGRGGGGSQLGSVLDYLSGDVKLKTFERSIMFGG